MIPHKLDDWLIGGPWKKEETSFNEKMLAGQLEPFVLYLAGNSSLSKTSRIQHELAHLVQVTNEEDMMSPTWGCSEFYVKGIGEDGKEINSPVSWGTVLTEIEVGVIESTIGRHVCQYFNYDAGIREIAISMMNPEDFPGSRKELEKYLHHLINQHTQWRSVENVWQELQRKYELIRRITNHG